MTSNDVMPRRARISRVLTRGFVLSLLTLSVATAQSPVFEPVPPPTQPHATIVGLNTTTGTLQAKATPDEWFCDAGGSGYSLGQVDSGGVPVQVIYDLYLSPNPNNKCLPGNEFAGSPRIPKINQGYVWGAAQVGSQIYFGTSPNGQCLTQAGVGGSPNPYNTGYWTCQFAESAYGFNLGLLGDYRPARFYRYDIPTQVITDITPKISTAALSAGACGTYSSANPYCMDPLWMYTRGIRAVTGYTETSGPNAGHTYVLASGPALNFSGSQMNFFAWDTTLNQWVAEYQVTGFNDQRHWVKDSNNILYAPVAKPGTGGGMLIRYYGNFQNVPAPPTPSSYNGYAQIPNCGAGMVAGPPAVGSSACFAFADVGDIDGIATDAAVHEGRVFVATWGLPGVLAAPGTCTPSGCMATVNNTLQPYPYAGIWMSPAIPSAVGLTNANSGTSGGWSKVWNALMYEPDPVVATGYDMGAMADYNGILYFGTMNAPWTSTARLAKYYGQPTDSSIAPQYVAQSWRAVVLLRGQGFTTSTPKIDLLYGAKQLPVYQPGTTVNNGTFVLTNNNMGGSSPLYGGAGINNAYNNYIWSMGVYNGRLYVGTMDWSFMAGAFYPPALNIPVLSQVSIPALFPTFAYGADLYFFANTSSAAVPESLNGVGNYLNYGIRNIFSYTYPNGTTSLFLGTANAMNLATGMNPATAGAPAGGWELIELKAASTVTKR